MADINGAIIQATREIGWTPTKLAAECGVTMYAADKWLKRLSKPSADTFLVLLRVLPGFAELIGVVPV